MTSIPTTPLQTDPLAAAAQATKDWLQSQQRLWENTLALQSSWLGYWLDCQRQWAQLPAAQMPAWMVWHNGTEQLA
jgi:hypothetical protein